MNQCARCGFHNQPDKRFCVRCGATLPVAASVRCGACGYQNEATKRFCGRCGSGLTPSVAAGPTARCAACGHANTAERRFCARCGTPLVASSVTPPAASGALDSLVGQMLTEYKITARVGQGGMATVFKAIQTTLKRPAAIKVLSPQLAGDPSLLARFHQEAICAASLEHPHIVPIYEVDQALGYHFIAMKYIDGVSLKDIIAQEGALTLVRVQELVDQIAGALDYAHGQGLVHRDVKPSNVMVTADDQVYLMDFGLSRAVASSQLTVTGTVMGTPDYMSPEQARGDADIDHRTDIYATSAMIYEMLTGQVPYHNLLPAAVIMAQITEPPPSVLALRPELPPAVDEVVQWGLAKDRAARPESAGALAAALGAAATSGAAGPTPRINHPATR